MLRRTYTLVSAAKIFVKAVLLFSKTRLTFAGNCSMDEYRETIRKDGYLFVYRFAEDSNEKVRLKLNTQAHERTVEDLFYPVFASPRQ